MAVAHDTQRSARSGRRLGVAGLGALALAVVAGVVYAVAVVQGNMVYEEYGGGQSVHWTPLEAGAFWSAGVMGAIGVVLLALDWITAQRRGG